MNQKQIKIIGYIVLVILLLNLILFAFVITNWIVFWGILVLGFIFIKVVLPKLKK